MSVSSDSPSKQSTGCTSSNFENSDEDYFEGEILPYAVEPVDDTSSDTDQVVEMEVEELSKHSEHENRLQNKDWCLCSHCQIMDRAEESVCCQEMAEVTWKNEQGAQVEQLKIPGCITDNSGFHIVCLTQWVLQTAWNQYRQEYGTSAYQGPEYKKKRHVAYRQLVSWCWGVLSKEIRMPLPSCAVSCIQAHFPPPGLEEEFVFDGFRYADE